MFSPAVSFPLMKSIDCSDGSPLCTVSTSGIPKSRWIIRRPGINLWISDLKGA